MSPVVVIGAGINGAALARELALSGVDTVVIDSADIGSGTTAYSSRLVHGGLRYLEFGDTELVHESLAERERLVTLAPDFVQPLEFRVPCERRLGGMIDGLGKLLLGGKYKARSKRGMWAVRFGLFWYDWLARGSSLPKARAVRIDGNYPHPPAARYRWVCAYSDAQMRSPEQFTVGLLEDARAAAQAAGTTFAVQNYCQVSRRGSKLVAESTTGLPPAEYEPAAIVNAGGPWGDDVARALGIEHRPMLAGTKGSHIVVFREDLREALGGAAYYAEASDGRPVFILPFGDGATLIGTTDLPYVGDPAEAVASEAEIDYLLKLSNDVLPRCPLTRADVAVHYSGVRPLPASDAKTPAAITRRHAIVEHSGLPWPAWSLVGGKLTTCRSLAEEAATAVLKRLDRSHSPLSRTRPIPRAVALADDEATSELVVGRKFTVDAVRAIIRTQWVRTLDDLVERRLMLLFARELRRETLESLAQLLVEEGVLAPDMRDAAVATTVERLRTHFGRSL
ncbi:MAG: FAD-dependent oxidoreductase [Planctomycetales bacterium]|nr:FAD-dependent oxidoreductase [Planctomycetales bacterium]MBN8628536.1 FAD-dependent oxidoreductase [Planctomycetota bacterium]